jgi:hypothetical protein
MLITSLAVDCIFVFPQFIPLEFLGLLLTFVRNFASAADHYFCVVFFCCKSRVVCSCAAVYWFSYLAVFFLLLLCAHACVFMCSLCVNVCLSLLTDSPPFRWTNSFDYVVFCGFWPPLPPFKSAGWCRGLRYPRFESCHCLAGGRANLPRESGDGCMYCYILLHYRCNAVKPHYNCPHTTQLYVQIKCQRRYGNRTLLFITKPLPLLMLIIDIAIEVTLD